jgi:RNA polymerase sigma-70 factor, ECF subfamily
VTGGPGTAPAGAEALLDLYDRALPQVFGYLRVRCPSEAVAEEITSEVFLAAVAALARGAVPVLTTAWLVGVARHKLADHWRRAAREDRKLQAAGGELRELDDPWEVHLDVQRAREVLVLLGPHHRAALSFRYLDGLAVPEVAELLGRTVHATEALLVRARAAFRRTYEEGDDDGA